MYTVDYQKKVGPYQFNTPLRQVPRAIDFHDSLSTPPDGIHSTPRYSYEHVLDGFDIRYTRDYKNARWLSSYVERDIIGKQSTRRTADRDVLY